MASTEVREPRQREISGVGDRDEGRSAAKGPSVAPEFGLGSGRTVGSGLVAMRFVAYTAAVLLFLALLPELVAQGDVGTFRENGPIEWLQFAILLVIAVLFLVGAHVAVRSRQLMVCFGLVVLLAATRELDSFLKARIPVLSWKGPLLALAVAAAVYLVPRFRVLTAQFRLFVETAAFALLWSGAVQVLIFAQLLGHGDFLQALMGDDYTRGYRRVIEESGELCGYGFLLFGGIEAVLWIRKAQVERGPADVADGSGGPA